MSIVKTDTKLIEKFLTRGVDKIFPNRDALKEKLLSGQRLRIYQGFDPTGPFLHVGHAMGIRALRILQELGHEVIFLVGDFTAMIGDPDKDKGRTILTEDTIQKNLSGWKEQAGRLIDFGGSNPVQFKRNSEWLSRLDLRELIKLMSNATVQQMIERDMFQKRLVQNNPIGLQEFIYPLMQGYDGVAMEVDLEIGGSDQTFNMLMGRTLMKNYKNKEKFVRTHELMDAPGGETMSKTKGNGINLADTAEDIYGKTMSFRDELISKALRLITDVELEEIWEIQKKIEAGENPMTYKKMLAYEVVKTLRGPEEALKAQDFFEQTVQKKEIVNDIIEITKVSGEMTVINFLKEITTEESTSNIRRLIEQGGIEINSQKITDPNEVKTFKSGDIIKFGKRRFFKIN